MLEKLFISLEKIMPEKYRWLFSHNGVKRYFANTGWMFLGQMFYLLLSFFIGAWIARYLGPENYGVISYVVAFVGLFSFVSSLGVDGVIKRELINTPERHNELMGTGFRLKLLGSSIAFFLVVIASFFFSRGSSLIQALIILFGLSFFLQVPFIISNFFYAQVKAKRAIQAQLSAAIISSLLKIALIFAGGGVIWLVLIYILDAIWQALFLIYFYHRENFHISSWRFNKLLASSIWRDSWPLMLSAAAGYIYLRIDQVMVGQIMGEHAVGIYAAGVKLTEVFYFIPGVICGSLFTAIINAKKTNSKTYFGRLKNLYLLLFGLALLVAVPISLLAKPIISLVFGASYLASAAVLQLYIWSSLGLFVGTGVSHQLVAENRTKTIFWLNFGTMILNIGLNILLIPKIGLTGAALSTLISYIVSPLWLVAIGWKIGKREYRAS